MFLPLNSFDNICVCFLLMIIYSTAGWVGEMITPSSSSASVKNVDFSTDFSAPSMDTARFWCYMY